MRKIISILFMALGAYCFKLAKVSDAKIANDILNKTLAQTQTKKVMRAMRL